MAILIHKVEKASFKDGSSSFSFQMTPEKIHQIKSRPVTMKIGSINTNQPRNILIAGSDRSEQGDLQNYLTLLDYPDFESVRTEKELLHQLKQMVMRRVDHFFCICEYQMLFHPGWELIEKLSALNDVHLPVGALLPPNLKTHSTPDFRMKNVEILGVPLKFSTLRRILFKYIGPPLKKLVQ